MLVNSDVRELHETHWTDQAAERGLFRDWKFYLTAKESESGRLDAAVQHAPGVQTAASQFETVAARTAEPSVQV